MRPKLFSRMSFLGEDLYDSDAYIINARTVRKSFLLPAFAELISRLKPTFLQFEGRRKDLGFSA